MSNLSYEMVGVERTVMKTSGIAFIDAEREWAYDRESAIGRLVRGLDEGPGRGWVIVDMQDDWEQVFP